MKFALYLSLLMMSILLTHNRVNGEDEDDHDLDGGEDEGEDYDMDEMFGDYDEDEDYPDEEDYGDYPHDEM